MLKRRFQVLGGTATLACVVVALVTAPAGTAGAACNATSAFASFGDDASYVLLNGGDLENGAAAVSTSGALVEENDPFQLAGADDGTALELGDGDTAVLRGSCIGQLLPSLRFVARSSAASGSLTVSIRYDERSGAERDVTLATLDASEYGEWSPTPILRFGDGSRRYADQARGNFQVVLTAAGEAVWRVDDLYVDPYCSR